MPWQATDAKKHIKGLQGGAAAKWAKIANGVLKSCQKDGGKDCEAMAIKIASTNARRSAQAEALIAQYSDTALEEAGRVFAARHYQRIKQAIAMLADALHDQDERDELKQPDAAKLTTALAGAKKAVAEALVDPVTDDEELTEAERSFDQTRQLVQHAITASLQGDPNSPGAYAYIRDLYDDTVVYEQAGKLNRASYSIDAGNEKVTLGDATPVIEKREYVAVSNQQESAPGHKPLHEDRDLIEHDMPGSTIVMLEEKALGPDGTVPILIASPGWGTKGHYSKEVLARDGPKAWPKGTQMYWNHPTEQEEAARPERDLRDLAAVTVSDPVFDENGPKGAGLYTKAKVFGQYQPAVDEMAPHIGVSLRAAGTVSWGEADGKEGPLVESILQGKSIDFVTKAGRGGEVISLFESARGGNFRQDVYAAPSNGRAAGGQEDGMPTQQELEEAQRKAAAADTRTARLEEALALRDARDYAAGILARATLPMATKERLLSDLPAKAPLAEADGVRALDKDRFKELVETAVKDENAYLSRVAGETGLPRDLSEAGGDPFNPVKPEPLDEAKVEEALGGLFRSIGLEEPAAKAAAHGRGW